MRRGRTLLAVALATVGMLAPVTSQAASVSGYLQNHGNGRGGEGPLADGDAAGWNGFTFADTLFSPNGFPIAQTGRPNQARWIAFGSFASGANAGALGSSTSTDGLTWSTPVASVLRDQQGQDIPFLVGNPARLAVEYITAGSERTTGRFMIMYRPAGTTLAQEEEFEAIDPNDPAFSICCTFGMPALHWALSLDGRTWTSDQMQNSIPPGNGSELIEPAGNRAGIVGPSDFIHQPGKNCLDSNSNVIPSLVPWGCEYVLIYTARDASGSGLSVFGAGGVFWSDIGLQLSARTTPLAVEGIAPWASLAIDRAHVTTIDPIPGCGSNPEDRCRFEMTFSGSTSNGRCGDAISPVTCDVGFARSATGLSFTPVLAGNEPNLTRELRVALGGLPTSTMLDLIRIGRKPEAKYYASSVTAGGSGRDLHLLIPTALDDSGDPRILFPTQQMIVGPALNALDVIVRDDLGPGTRGIDLASLTVSIDGVPLGNGVAGGPITTTLLGAVFAPVNGPGYRFTIDVRNSVISEGAHTLEISVKDKAGNGSTLLTPLIVDRTPPSSEITKVVTPLFDPIGLGEPVGVVTGYPFMATWFEGKSQEALTGLIRMRAVLTDPLGNQKVFEQGPTSGNTYGGWTFYDIAPDRRSWNWRWSVPNDPFFLLPGSYRFTIGGVDDANNVESPTGENSRSIVLI